MNMVSKDRQGNKKKLYMATLHDLFIYISKKRQKMHIILPNDKKVYIPTLLDSILISYLHTAALLWKKYKMIVTDQHLGNMFIQWLDKRSYYDEKNIGHIKKIYYKIGKEYLGIETNEMLFKLGDLGVCRLSPKKGVFIAGVGRKNNNRYNERIL